MFEVATPELGSDARGPCRLIAVRYDEPAPARLDAKSLLGKPRFELGPTSGGHSVLSHRRSNQVVERQFAGSLPFVELARSESVRSVGSLLSFQPEVVSRHGAQGHLALLLAERTFDARVVVPMVPRPKRLRVYPVDHEMHVRVASVAVGDDQRLMFIEAEVIQEPVGDADHCGAIDAVVRIEGERDVVDRLLDADRLRGRRAHEKTRRVWVVRRKIARLDPFDTVRRSAVAAGLEVAREARESAALHHLADHAILRGGCHELRSIIRNDRRTQSDPYEVRS